MTRRSLHPRSNDVPMQVVAVGLVLLCVLAAFAATNWAAAQNAKPSLDEALAHLEVPLATGFMSLSSSFKSSIIIHKS